MEDAVQQAVRGRDTPRVGPEPWEATQPQLLSALQALISSQQRIEAKLDRLATGLTVHAEGQPAPPDVALDNISDPLGGKRDTAPGTPDDGHEGFGSHVFPADVSCASDEAAGVAREGLAQAQDAISVTSCDDLSASAAWPSSVTLRRGFEDEPERLSEQTVGELLSQRLGSGSDTPSSFMDRRSRMTRAGSFIWPKQRISCCAGCRRLAFDPNSRCMMLSEVVGIIALTFDLLAMPVIISWDILVEGTLLHLAWCAGLYWTLDIFANFMTGFYHRGELVMTQPEVCQHYLRTGFVMDFILLLGDWTTLLVRTRQDLDSISEGATFLRIAKASRLLKVFRITRLIKLFEKISTSATSHNVRMLSQVLSMVCGTLFSCHVLCCAWFLLGRAGPTATGLTWLDTPLFADEGTIRGAGAVYQYVASFQWTVAQITLGASDVAPVNLLERIVNILLLILGLLFGCTIVAFLSAQIVQFIVRRQAQTQKLDDLRTFLRQASVPTALSKRVTTQVSELLSKEKMLEEKDVAALGLLSSALRSELQLVTRLPHIVTHPLFQTWRELDMSAVRLLCEVAVRVSFVPNWDVVFVPGTLAEEAHYVMRGRLLYTPEPQSPEVPREAPTQVQQGSWLCEAALWSDWAHVGMLEATAACQLLSVSASGLLQVLDRCGTITSLTKSYGRNFHARLTSAMPPHADWPSDLGVPFTNASELLSQDMGIALLKHAMRTGELELTKESCDQLTAELRQGLCTLQRSIDGSGLERIVTLVTVRIEQEGRRFTKVGKWDGDAARGAQPACQLPGGKRAARELPRAALRRVLHKDLAPLAPYLAFDGTEHTVEQGHSEKYDIPTMYMRTVHRANLTIPSCQIEMPEPMLSCGQAPDCPVLRELVRHEVYALPDGQGLALYCWLLPAEWELLQEPVNAALWKQWLGHMCPPHHVRHVDI